MSGDKCCIKGCRGSSDIIYLRRGLCNKCWDRLSELSTNETRIAVGLKPLRKGFESQAKTDEEPEDEQAQQEPVASGT